MNDARFRKIVEKTLGHEGGYVNDPADPGGETQWGISKRAYPNVDIKALTRDGAIAIYYRDYWLAPGWDKIEDDTLAARLFDLGVNCGTVAAAKMLQNSLNLLGFRTAVDGQAGPETLQYANTYRHPKALLAAVKYHAARGYVGLNKPRFLAGWLARLES